MFTGNDHFSSCRLPHKVRADSSGKPVMFAHTHIGVLNTFVELWRYPNSQSWADAQEKLYKVPEWMKAVEQVSSSVQHVSIILIRPVWFSVWL
jgi:beta-mannanase